MCAQGGWGKHNKICLCLAQSINFLIGHSDCFGKKFGFCSGDTAKFIQHYFRRLRLIAARRNSVKRGCGAKGRAWNSGWNCVPSIKGCTEREISAISISTPSGEVPEKTRPASSSGFTYAGLIS